MQVRCGQCGRQLRLDDVPDERTVICPQCEHVLSIAHLRALADAEAPARPSFTDDDEVDFAQEARLSLRKKIRIICGKCGRGLKVEAQFAGKGVRCPACGEPIRIPFPDEEMEFELADLKAGGEELEVLSEEVQRRAVESGDREEDQAEREVEMLLAGQRRARRMWVTVIAVVVIGWLGALGVWLGHRYYPEADKPDQTSVRPGPGADSGRSRPATRPIATRPAVPTRPAAQPSDFAVLGTELSSFAGSGLFPARPAWRFLRIEVMIEARGKPVLIQARGKDVTFLAGEKGEKVFESLGVPAGGDSLLPRRGAPRAVRVEPGRSAVVTFLFEVPDSTRDGVLRIRGAGETAVGPFPSPPDQRADAVAGTYVQAAPRNLKPLLRDPVMAAIQKAPLRHRLSVEDSDGGLVVSIPAAGVSGIATPGENGLYGLVLRRGQHTLRCKLRLAEDGERIILYLTDEPFGQLIYAPAEEW